MSSYNLDRFSKIKVWQQVVPWIINTYPLITSETPNVAPGFLLSWRVTNLWGYNKIGIREMNSDFMFYIRDP